MQNRPLSLEVPVGGDPEALSKRLAFPLSEHRVNLLDGPGVVEALTLRRISVLSRVKAPSPVCHLRQQPVEDPPRHISKSRVGRHLVRLEVGPRDESIVVQHLLEVRNKPDPVRRIPVEPPSEMVVNASRGHRFERLDDRAQGEFLLRPEVIPEKEAQLGGEGEFRGSAKAPVLRVKGRDYRGVGRIEKAGRELLLLVLRVTLLDRLRQPTRVFLDLTSPLLPEIRDELEQLGETR